MPSKSTLWDKPIIQYSMFILVTLIYFWIICHFFNIDYAKLKELKPNDLGGFLSGAFAPLGFIFLILGYMQNTQALKIQSEELKVSNESLKQQVEEMQKSVDAQQSMFNLAEQQFIESKAEKADLNKPKLTFVTSNYSYALDSRTPKASTFRFNLTIKNSGILIQNLIVHSNFWSLLLNASGSLDYKIKDVSYPELGQHNQIYFLFYAQGEINQVLNNNTISLKFKDSLGHSYDELYTIINTNDGLIEIVKSTQHH